MFFFDQASSVARHTVLFTGGATLHRLFFCFSVEHENLKNV